MASEAEPWRRLPPEVSGLIEPALGPATAEILTAIAEQVPEYARPLEGSFGRGVRTGVGEALRQFVALIAEPEEGRVPELGIYRELGRGELNQGRTLDSLQAAYRVGARVAWRHIAETAERGGLDARTLSLLAESVFAYIDHLAGASVEGYAEALAEREDERFRRRRTLVRLLVGERRADDGELEKTARAAHWKLPRRLAPLACREQDLERLRGRLPPEALTAVVEGVGCALLPDATGPGRMAMVRRAAAGTTAALGPEGSPGELRAGWTLARAAHRAYSEGMLRCEPPAVADEHLALLLLSESEVIAEAIARRRLQPFAGLSEKRRGAMEATALAYVQHGGNATAMGRALHLHPQTIRYRVRRLRELIGSDLDDPDAAFELEAALRRRGLAA